MPKRSEHAHKKGRKKYTSDDVYKLFYERDILLEKLHRRNEQLLGSAGESESSDSDSRSSPSSS